MGFRKSQYNKLHNRSFIPARIDERHGEICQVALLPHFPQLYLRPGVLRETQPLWWAADMHIRSSISGSQAIILH